MRYSAVEYTTVGECFGIRRVDHAKYYTMCASEIEVSLRGRMSQFLLSWVFPGLALNNEKVHPSMDMKDFIDTLESFYGSPPNFALTKSTV